MLKLSLTAFDYSLIAIYFVFVLGIGVVLRRSMNSGENFLLSGRSLPAWICGLAFLSELRGLVYSLTERTDTSLAPWYMRPGLLGLLILAAVALLNLAFW